MTRLFQLSAIHGRFFSQKVGTFYETLQQNKHETTKRISESWRDTFNEGHISQSKSRNTNKI